MLHPAKAFRRTRDKVNLSQAIIYILAHVVLAYAMKASGWITNGHAYAVLIIGIFFVLISKRKVAAGYMGAYIVSSQVLWAMTDANIYYEYGKYVMALLFTIAILKNINKIKLLPIIYFVCLLPSIAVLYETDLSVSEIRNQISFNLSGPFLLCLSILYFKSLEMTKEEVQKLLLIIVGPAVSMLVLIQSKIAIYDGGIEFIAHSMYATSGGAGPNRASAILGLGALISFYFILISRNQKSVNIVMATLGIALAAQSALTFSRGGLYCAAIAGLAASFAMVKDKKKLIRYIVIILFIAFVAERYVLPKLTNYTGGKITERFLSTEGTGREAIASTDYHLWLERPMLGWGPGGAANEKVSRFNLETIYAAHTEYTRVLAEHGILGIISLLALLSIAISSYMKAKSMEQKSVVLAFMAWGAAFMVINAMRLAAPSFMIGLGCVTIINAKKNILKKNIKKNIPKIPGNTS